MRKQFWMTILVILAVSSVASACAGRVPPGAVTPPAAALNSATKGATEAPAPAAQVDTPATVAAAAPTRTTQPSAEAPRFTHPTEITNPFYPVSLIGQAISLGTESGGPFRTEVTLLAGTTTITWDGQQIEALVSQYAAYAGSKLVEVAYDSFAQADDGGVYYLGEEVTNYRDGQVVDHGGSWLAGKDGAPPALIMPAHPAVGQIFKPENSPGLADETDEILSLSQKTITPDGPIEDGVLIKEILMDGSIEHKVNAANYGIVESQAEDEQVNLVWLNRTDAKPGTVPEQLSTMEAQAEDIMDLAPAANWKQVAADVIATKGAWQAYERRATSDRVPKGFQEATAKALEGLEKALATDDLAGTMQAANNLSAAVVDLFTVYRPETPADLGRMDVLERQVLLDVTAHDLTAAADNLAKTNAVWARLKSKVIAHDGFDAATHFETSLSAQQAALKTENTAAVITEANGGLELIDALERLF